MVTVARPVASECWDECAEALEVAMQRAREVDAQGGWDQVDSGLDALQDARVELLDRGKRKPLVARVQCTIAASKHQILSVLAGGSGVAEPKGTTCRVLQEMNGLKLLLMRTQAPFIKTREFVCCSCADASQATFVLCSVPSKHADCLVRPTAQFVRGTVLTQCALITSTLSNLDQCKLKWISCLKSTGEQLKWKFCDV